MIAAQVTHVQVHRLPSGDFAFEGKTDGGRIVPIAQLRKLVFAWHSRSFHGTILETIELESGQGLLLAPFMALNYLSEPAPMLHGDLDWSKEFKLLNKAAVLFKAALQSGWYRPSYEAWRRGEPGWKLELPVEKVEELEALLREAEQEGILYLQQWFSDSLNGMLQQEQEVAAAWEVLAQGNPLLQPGEDKALVDQSWIEEEEWLIAIGWKQDEVPFRTCLQLIEPDQIHEWGLRIILQDKSNSHMFVELDASGNLLTGAIPTHWQEHVEHKLSNDIAKCLKILPQLVSKEVPGALLEEMSDDEAWTFMDEGSLRLVQAGFSVLLPSWWEELRLLKPQLKAQIHSSVGSKNNSMFGMNQLMQFDWKVAVGQVNLSEEEFRQIAEEKKRLINIRGNWVQLDPALLEKILLAMKQVEKNKGLSLREVLEMHLMGEESEASAKELQEGSALESGPDESGSLQIQVELNNHLKNLMKKLGQTKSIPLIEAPKELNAQLRHYQLEGVSWLLYLRQFGLGGCLADDMGLGKTIQFITYLLLTKKENHSSPALLICPTSVIGNWQKELEKFAPSLKVHLHYGSQRAKGEEFTEALEDIDLVITSYSLSHLDEEELSAVEWDTVCLDEAQNIKNAYTKQASAIRKLNAHQRIALTGTPIENRLTELWSIFDFINPGYLGSLKRFSDKFVKAIEKDGDEARTGQVQSLIRPFLLRRVKKDPAIQLDLPEKNEAKTYVSLTVEQGTLYENIVQNMLEKIETLTGMEKKGLILATLTKLKQICNHPALFLKETGHGGGELVRSHKLSRLLEMIDELREEGESCLIFTQFVEMGNILQAAIEEERQEPVQFLHGGLTKVKRDQMIARFQDPTSRTEEACSIFILSLKAGGTGLNLTAANHVFHYDRWWNPAVENQATDRAFRIGQTRDVQVHKFVTLGTLEERIDEMIERKQDLSQQIVGSGESWVTEMSTNELRDLFAMRKQWIEK
jgi:SNF2 family DNA or RNA helicase